jgi:pseudo-rSAM protein
MPIKYYWFYLEPFVYISIKGNDLLLYNTLTGNFLTYMNSPRFVDFLFDLNRKENLYAIKVSREFLRDNGLKEFVDDIYKNFMGDLVDISLSYKKPFIMPPHFDIQDESNNRQHRTLKNVSNESLFSINELTFFVNSRCDNKCFTCKNAFKQFLWCTRGKNDIELKLTEIIDILEQIKGCPINNINIIGGDLNKYTHFNQLVDLLSSFSFNSNYYFHFSHLKNGLPDSIRARGLNIKVILLVDFSTITFPIDFNYVNGLNPDAVVFLIQSEEEITILEGVIEEFKTRDISVQPYYNNQNIEFFKKNVFFDLEMLSERILKTGVIKARKSYNTLNYGKMYISSNKKIYSDLNDTPLGRIGDISMEKAVVSELSEQGNWLRVRRDVIPCRDCLLNAICPPLSNIEKATGINNSCNIWKDHSIIE